MTKQLQDLLIELPRTNPLWTDLMDVLEESNKEQVIDPTRELELLRNINSSTDPVFIEKTFRQMGFNIATDLLNLNRDKLNKIVYMLPLYNEVVGTPSYPKFLEFLLGRGVILNDLYTQNYSDFYPSPLGKLLEDGGTWYKTTHVDLTIEQKGLEGLIVLKVENKDIEGLLSLRDINASTESTVLALRGKILDAANDDPIYVNYILIARLLDLFYRYAPVEEVVKGVYLSIRCKLNLYLSATAVVKPKEYLSLDGNVGITFRVLLNRNVNSFEAYSVAADIEWSNGTRSTAVPTLFHSEYVESYDGQNIVFKEVSDLTTFQLEFQTNDMRKIIDINLYPSGVPVVPDSIEIRGPSNLQEGSTIKLEAYGIYGAEKRIIADTENLTWYSESESTVIEFGLLSCLEIFEPELDTITVTYIDNDNHTHTAYRSINLLDTLKPLKPRSLEIIVSDDLVQGQEYPIQGRVTYTDNTVLDVPVLWNLKSKSASISTDNILTSNVVGRDYNAELNAKFQDHGVIVEANADLSFKYPNYVVYKLEIVSPDSMLENTRLNLSAVAYWTSADMYQDYVDGNILMEDIVGFTSIVNADWSSKGVAEIDGDTIISPSVFITKGGILQSPEVTDTTPILITASILDESFRRVEDTVMINVNPVERRISYVQVVTKTSIKQDEINHIRVIATWNDSTKTEMDVDGTADYTLDLIVEGEVVSVSDLGITNNKLHYLGESTGVIEVVANIVYTHTTIGGDTEEQEIRGSLPVALIPRIVLSDSLSILAPNSVVFNPGENEQWLMFESTRAFFAAEVTYQDGSSENVEALWSIKDQYGTDGEEDEILADLSQGFFTLRQMVKVLTSKDAEDVYTELYLNLNGTTPDLNEVNISEPPVSLIKNHLKLQGYSEFDNLETFADLDEEVHRCHIQARFIDEDLPILLQARYFKESAEESITLLNGQLEPHNRINGSRILGPMEFNADTLVVSYALIVDYDDGGEEYEVSSAWKITVHDKRAALLSSGIADTFVGDSDINSMSDEELDRAVPDNQLLVIDDDGYMYPKVNMDLTFTLSALYDDFRTQFTKDVEVQMRRANTELESLSITGPSSILDIADSNLIVNDGRPYVQFEAQLTRSDGTIPYGVFARWSVVSSDINGVRSEINGINIGEIDGKLYLEEQPSNQEFYIEASFQEVFDDHTEVVTVRKKVSVIATRALSSINIVEPSGIINDATVLPLDVELHRGDGSTSLLESGGQWTILETDANISLIDNIVSIPKLVDNASVKIHVKVTEGDIELDDTIDLNIVSQNALRKLELLGPTLLRDDSSTNYLSILYRNSTPDENLTGVTECGSRECVTDLCFWSIVNNDPEGDLGGTTIDARTGALDCRFLVQDIEATVTCLYKEQGQQTSVDKVVTIKSSLPRYGIAPAGLNTFAELEALTDRVTSDRGGSFSVNVIPDGITKQYCYFAHRKDFGLTRFVESNNLNTHGGWQGASWPTGVSYINDVQRQTQLDLYGSGPIEIEVPYGDASETWYVYRTELGNSQINDFSYMYE